MICSAIGGRISICLSLPDTEIPDFSFRNPGCQREGGFAGILLIEQNKNFVQFRGGQNHSGAGCKSRPGPRMPAAASAAGVRHPIRSARKSM